MVKRININKYPTTKKYVSLYFHVHQPYRISSYSAFDVGTNKYYFDGPEGQTNNEIIQRVVERGYLKANAMFLDLITNHNLKISYSITGTVLEQLEEHGKEVIEQWKDMVATGNTELIAETFYHSLSAFYSTEEFVRQVNKHSSYLENTLGFKPKVFRNTEFTYRNDVGEIVRQLGFNAIYAEGWDPILQWRSPNFIYKAKHMELEPEQIEAIKNGKLGRAQKDIKLLLKNYNRSDDVAFRFQLKGWEGYPVTADKFAHWIDQEPGFLINLCMDYETIGEHHRVESGIFEFYKHLPEELAKKGVEFILPSDAVKLDTPSDTLDYPYIVSWADMERDLSAWIGNSMQEKSLESIYKLAPKVFEKAEKLTGTEKEIFLDTWGRLQTSDHFYYMSTKYWSDGDVHKYFSPYNSPYEAYINFMNVLRDFKIRYLNF